MFALVVNWFASLHPKTKSNLKINAYILKGKTTKKKHWRKPARGKQKKNALTPIRCNNDNHFVCIDTAQLNVINQIQPFVGVVIAFNYVSF